MPAYVNYLKAGYRFIRSKTSSSETVNKRNAELAFWHLQKGQESTLGSEHFEYFFTEHFGIDSDFYTNKRVLDIGCGPRGSLEWANSAAQRVGLDPLVNAYRELGIDNHETEYVNSGAEDIPFDDGHFDIVSSINNLDHVDDLTSAIEQIKRVTASGGTFILITEVNHEPTVTEPRTFSWEIVDRFTPEFELVNECRRLKSSNGVLNSAKSGDKPIPSDNATKPAILSARFERTQR
jgi:ubiquinone/menaquinone biosynthesis C-methylase UbiE